jgi:DNA-directed RNA polymerase specialized sigma24 family protein
MNPGNLNDTKASVARGAADFRTTDWSMVLSAQGGQSTRAEEALAKLCATYWYPLYAFVRRQGYSPHDAQDLAQSFFAFLLQKHILDFVDSRKGKFRSFLLSSLKNFLANDWDRKHAIKRGGRFSFISWDEETAENLYLRATVVQISPDQEFERNWATVLLQRVQTALRNEYATGGKVALFDVLEPYVCGDTKELSYAELSVPLGMTEGALKMAAVRLRKRFREQLRAEIGNTVASEKEIEEEIGFLLAALSS